MPTANSMFLFKGRVNKFPSGGTSAGYTFWRIYIYYLYLKAQCVWNSIQCPWVALHCSALLCSQTTMSKYPRSAAAKDLFHIRHDLIKTAAVQLAGQPYGVLLTHKRLTRYQCLTCWTALIYVPVHFRVASNRISDSRTPRVLHELLRSFACIASYITANIEYECKTISTWEFLIPGARGLLPTTHWACKSCKELLNRAQTLWR